MKDTGGPAFPNYLQMCPQDGMTLRDYFAAKALPSVLTDFIAGGHFPDNTWRVGVALDCYAMADAMLEARK